MSFPVFSTSVGTRSARRAMRVMQRTKVAHLISRAGQYDCRDIAGSDPPTPSQHSYGNADDLFPMPPTSNDDRDRRAIFHATIWQATHRTRANRFRRLPIAHAIDHDARLIWTPADGIHVYTGDAGDHIHLDYFPQYSGPCGSRP